MAQRRIAWDSTFEEWRRYEVLVAPADCHLLGKSGWLITPEMTYTAIVVDCATLGESMNGIMADTNLDSVGSGWLVLK